MKTSLGRLPQDKQDELRKITDKIVEWIKPEKVILFGSYATGKWQEDWHMEGHIMHEYQSDYDLLVVVSRSDTRPEHHLQEMIETKCQPLTSTPVNVIVHGIDYVNRRIAEGQYFFTDIKKEGILLYDAGNIKLSEQRELTPQEKKDIAQRNFEKYFFSGKNLLVKASDYNTKEPEALNDAVFLLHQAAERIYNAMILVFTGYKSRTHNLGKLVRMSREYSPELATLFPNNSPQEIHLFTLLKKAYVDARYNESYIITEAELNILIERVKRLREIAERVCRDKIALLMK